MPPLISVIVPFKNEMDELKDCLWSLKRQTFTNFEIILIADGSCQEGINIAEAFKWPYKQIILLAQSQGQSIARNKGIEVSKGKYIAIQDADDTSLPQRLEKQVKFLESNPNISVLGSAARLKGKEYIWSVYQKSKTISDQLAINNPMVHSSVMMRKEVLVNYPYDNTYNTAEDYALFTKIKDKYKIANMAEPLVQYKEPEPNKSSLLDQRMKARILREQNNQGILEKYVTALHYFCELAHPIENNEMVYLKNWFEVNHGSTVFNDQFLRYGLKYPSYWKKSKLIKAWAGSKLMRKASVLKRLF